MLPHNRCEQVLLSQWRLCWRALLSAPTLALQNAGYPPSRQSGAQTSQSRNGSSREAPLDACQVRGKLAQLLSCRTQAHARHKHHWHVATELDSTEWVCSGGSQHCQQRWASWQRPCMTACCRLPPLRLTRPSLLPCCAVSMFSSALPHTYGCRRLCCHE